MSPVYFAIGPVYHTCDMLGMMIAKASAPAAICGRFKASKKCENNTGTTQHNVLKNLTSDSQQGYP